MVPRSRIFAENEQPVRRRGDHVVYWMIASRRCRYNQGLERALGWAEELGLPLVVVEPLRVDYRWAADRHHRFVIEGMVDNAAALSAAGVAYHPYVEPAVGAGKGLLEAWWARAAVVITDRAPILDLPRMVVAAAARCPCRLESVDSNGLLPLSAMDKPHSAAVHFRRAMQKVILPHLAEGPMPQPLAARRLPALQLPAEILDRWPAAALEGLLGLGGLDALPIDHGVGPVANQGGARAAAAKLERFVSERLPFYGEERSDVVADRASGLSAHLHFGHISAREVFDRVAAASGWEPERVAEKVTASKEGWWGMGASAESFIDELVVWRELGFSFAHQVPNNTEYSSLPDWARATLDAQREAPRPRLYSLAALEAARTHDALWNAAQRQLMREGIIHNYLRMVWGKKILEWSESPEAALERMFHLNNKYALDGRDPNSMCGITWCLGRFDRPWAPLRPIFGSVRYMSSDNTMKKMNLKPYLAEYLR